MNASVFRSEEDFSIVKGGGGHILIVSLVGERKFPEQTATGRLNAHEGPVIPGNDLADAIDLD